MPVCPTCKGRKVRGLRVDFDRTDGRVFDGEDPNQPCPSCSGRGWVLDEEALEKAAEAIEPYETFQAGDGHPGVRVRDKKEMARAAILAYLEHKEESSE